MTNIPTLDGILILLLVITFIPFWTAFAISYITYRRLGIGFLGGLSGIISFIIVLPLLDCDLWIRGTIAGMFGGIVLCMVLSKYYKPVIPEFKIDRKKIIYIAVIAGLILSIYLCYSSERADLEFCVTDPAQDVSYSGYFEQKVKGHNDIDILRLESRVIGNTVILETEFAGEVKEEGATEYTCHIATQEMYLWTEFIPLKEMEKDGKILRAKIPIESLEDRKVFHVLVVASKFDESKDLNIYDNCANRGDFWQFLKILTS
ncbi:MAG: hypothetical protein ACPK85_01770 [Methanosarcina sp.]